MYHGQLFPQYDRGPYATLVERARAADITLSSIAIGGDADTGLLQNLARWGAGRYHFAAQPSDIPRLTLIESQIASAEPQIEGDFRAELRAPHPLLRDFAPNQIPKLGGYVGTTIKPAAELALKSPDLPPRAGRLAVWPGPRGGLDAQRRPTLGAAEWPELARLRPVWAQIVRYTLPKPGSGPLQVRATPAGDALRITVDSLAPSGEPIDLADTEATITLPDWGARAACRCARWRPAAMPRIWRCPPTARTRSW